MGKASRDKGLRRERAIVDVHRKSGIHAERVPLSGALGYRGNDADVDLYVRGAAPVKAEAVFFSAARSAACCGWYQTVS